MKHGFLKALALAALVSMIICQPSAFAQGSLAPPGAPGVTMKTLDQVEPRIPISSATYDITRAGSYYLTTNISGLSIQSGNVTLDLMGYSISASGGSAIYFYDAYINVVIRNGTLSSSIGNGIQCGATASNARGLIEQVRIQNCSGTGLNLPAGYVVRDCEIYGCSYGIVASGAIEVRNCRLESNGTALILPGSSTVIGNTIINNTGDGLQVTGTGSYVADNIVKGNRDNYNISAGNQLNLLLSQIPETLDWPCSVKLAGTLTCSLASSNGITVNANDVTIDLAGHTLIGSGANSGHGIYQDPAYRNLAVLNGKAVDWRGSGMAGVYASGSSACIQNVQAATNYSGIYTGPGSTISSCIVMGNADDGIYANSGSAISGCTAQSNGGTGIHATSGCIVSGCTARSNGSIGILALAGCTVSGCAATYNASIGMYIDSDSFVTGNTCGNNNGNSGFYLAGGDNRIMDNNATDNARGFHVPGSGNFIARNTCSGNTTNWVVAANNKVGTIIVAPNSVVISGDSGGTGVGSTDPWANFSY